MAAPPDDPTTIEPLRKHTALPPKVTVADGDVVLESARRGSVELQLTNPSSIVEGYRIELVAAPPWLSIAVPETRLLPGDRAAVRIGFDVRPGTLVVAQRVRLRLRLRPESDQRVHTDAEVALVVPRVGGPARIRTEPAVVRVKDAAHGRFTVQLDNRGSNHPRRYVMSGADDEGVVRFSFDPEVVEAPPDGGTAVYVQVTAPPPTAGERSERNLTVRAKADPADDGLGAVVRLIHETSAAPVEVPVRLRLEPSALRTADSDLAELHVVVDNRAGHRDRRVWLAGHDPEQQIGFVFRTAELWVAPGTERATLVQLRAPVPPPGDQADRTFTVTATDGRHEIESAGHWVQRSGTAPITTAALRLDPEVVRLRDRSDAQLSVVIDNQRGSRPLRVRLSGDDPENAVHFAFRPPVLDVGPGRTAWAEIRVAAPHPPHGEETVRTIRVRASDEHGAVEATGAVHQYSSPAAISTARLSLEPQRVVVRGGGTGRLRVHLDNRAGAFPLSAHLHGLDPEQVVRFVFRPAVLDVAPGQAGVADVRVSAPRPDGGETSTRPFTIIADDGRGVVEAAGSLVQSAGDRRPIWRVVLTVLGTLLVAVGCFRDWLSGDPNTLLPSASTIPASIGNAVGAGAPGSARDGGRPAEDAPADRTDAHAAARGGHGVRAHGPEGAPDPDDRNGGGCDHGRGRVVLAPHGSLARRRGATGRGGRCRRLRRRPVRTAMTGGAERLRVLGVVDRAEEPIAVREQLRPERPRHCGELDARRQHGRLLPGAPVHRSWSSPAPSSRYSAAASGSPATCTTALATCSAVRTG